MEDTWVLLIGDRLALCGYGVLEDVHCVLHRLPVETHLQWVDASGHILSQQVPGLRTETLHKGRYLILTEAWGEMAERGRENEQLARFNRTKISKIFACIDCSCYEGGVKHLHTQGWDAFLFFIQNKAYSGILAARTGLLVEEMQQSEKVHSICGLAHYIVWCTAIKKNQNTTYSYLHTKSLLCQRLFVWCQLRCYHAFHVIWSAQWGVLIYWCRWVDSIQHKMILRANFNKNSPSWRNVTGGGHLLAVVLRTNVTPFFPVNTEAWMELSVMLVWHGKGPSEGWWNDLHHYIMATRMDMWYRFFPFSLYNTHNVTYIRWHQLLYVFMSIKLASKVGSVHDRIMLQSQPDNVKLKAIAPGPLANPSYPQCV